MKRIFLAGLMAAAVIFTSCNKEEGTNISRGNETATVLLTIEHDRTPASRAEADRVVDHQLTLQEGYIFFVESNGVIVRYLEMKTGANSSDPNELEFTSIVSGKVTIDDVKTSASKCYIFTNIPAVTKAAIDGMTITEGSTKIDVIFDLEMELNDLVDTNFAVAKMPQFGEGNVIQPVADGDPLTTLVKVYAMGSRLQIQKLTGYDDITDYKLDGIFVNNYFEEMPVSYTLDFDDIVNNGSDVNKYDGTYAPYLALELSDYIQGACADINVVGSDVEATPLTEEVWAYNIWPTEGVPSADQLAATPHLIFVLRDVEYEESPGTFETVAGPLYLTVKGMKSGGTQVPNVQKGNSYTFTNIKFKFSDLTTVPEVESIEAEVTIQMIDWKDNDVEEIL